MFGKRGITVSPEARFTSRPMPGDPVRKPDAAERLKTIINPNQYQHHKKIHSEAKPR